MKRIIWSCLLCTMIFIRPAFPAKMCLKQESNPTCTITRQGDADTIITCGSTTFHFVQACSSSSGSNGEIKDSLDPIWPDGNYCWIKMISPKTTNWLYISYMIGGCVSVGPCSRALYLILHNNISSGNLYQTLMQILNGSNPIPSQTFDLGGSGGAL